ncbi:MAG: divalent metal cation transporter FieF [Gammaproteobacteria bacterium]|nr:MAG: divalent metal cation transporter FieF [Gammaproteobacteria bacterium]
MQWASYASVATALLLITVKIAAWFATDSVSILATLIDSSLDVLASIINLIAVRQAIQPPDKEHRFGHGKAEALAGVGQSMFIAGSAGILLLQAVERLFNPREQLVGFDIGLAVMAFSMAVTVLLLCFQSYVIRQTNSMAIKADALHYRTDLWVNAAVIIALLLAAQGYEQMDAFFAIAIAVFILSSVWAMVKESIDLLMDHELPDEDLDKIKAVVRSDPHSEGFHDLRTRRAANKVFIQLHLELDEGLLLKDAHRITDRLEQKLKALFSEADVIIHEDPVIITNK